MCGIAGIFNLNAQSVDLGTLKQFTDSMVHRGPDGGGYELLNNNLLGLGQRRLSILDLSSLGKQPMSYLDDRYWITYNGEVFNFEDIKKELVQAGFVFKSQTDTEVILAAYVFWGKQCLDKFNGMWAFAIWDRVESELFLARDRFGIKPLYYLHEPGKQFAFASETRAFKHLEGFNRRINPELLKYNQQDPYAIEGLGYTIFEGIYQLLPAHYMVIKKDQVISQKRWWHIEDHLQVLPESFEEQCDQFYELFRDACRIRLVSDVPIGTALSGGLDSTAVYSTVFNIIQKESLGRVNSDTQRAFTATFPGLPQDERLYAEKAAQFTNGNISFIEPNNIDLAKQIEIETELSDFLSVSPITSISAVYKGMRCNGIVVSMDGHGVDEMLYGYRDMVYALYNEALWNAPLKDAESMEKILSSLYHPNQWNEVKLKFDLQLQNKKVRESSPLHGFKKWIKGKPINTEFLPIQLPSLSDKPYDFSHLPVAKRMVFFEFFQHTLPALLRNFDRAGMMNSIEIRMPFMDWRLVSFVFSLPIESKISEGFTKRIVRESMKGKMDESLRIRTYKVGIGSPIDHWFNTKLKDWSIEQLSNPELKILAETSLKSTGGYSSDIVRQMWQDINIQLIQ